MKNSKRQAETFAKSNEVRTLQRQSAAASACRELADMDRVAATDRASRTAAGSNDQTD